MICGWGYVLTPVIRADVSAPNRDIGRPGTPEGRICEAPTSKRLASALLEPRGWVEGVRGVIRPGWETP